MAGREFLFLIASPRSEGNSEQLARHAARSLPAEIGRSWLRLDDHPLPPFRDLRHSGGYPPPAGNELVLVDATLAATDLVFVTPVHWYALPAAAKLYLDHWSAWMRAASLDFTARMRGRRMWAVVVDSSEPADAAFAPLIDCLVRSADYMDMHWMGALHGHGNRPGEALVDPAILAAADRFFAEVVAQ